MVKTCGHFVWPLMFLSVVLSAKAWIQLPRHDSDWLIETPSFSRVPIANVPPNRSLNLIIKFKFSYLSKNCFSILPSSQIYKMHDWTFWSFFTIFIIWSLNNRKCDNSVPATAGFIHVGWRDASICGSFIYLFCNLVVVGYQICF